jgi:CheY-like chemotaxis protein
MPTILVVDDDAETCRNMADLFGDRGYAIETAESGDTALVKARQQRYYLGLLELRMPGMDGLTLCRHLKRLQPPMVSSLPAGPGPTGAGTGCAGRLGAWSRAPGSSGTGYAGPGCAGVGSASSLLKKPRGNSSRSGFLRGFAVQLEPRTGFFNRLLGVDGSSLDSVGVRRINHDEGPCNTWPNGTKQARESQTDPLCGL